jgi:hypothetical protein
MENLIKIPQKELPYFPGVNFNFETGVCVLSEESYMEESYSFYKPLMDWIKEYFKHKKTLEFNFKFTYFNTSTSKMIIEILELLEHKKAEGNSITINWYLPVDDPDMLLEVEDFEQDAQIEINKIIVG